MEKITKKILGNNAVDVFDVKKMNWSDKDGRNAESAYTGKAINRLAEYEDIGLTPEEIKYFLKDFGVRLVKENRELKKQYKEDKRICIACSGSGWYDNCDKQGNPILCGACDGTGYKD